MVALDSREWLGTARGRIVFSGFVVLLVVVAGLAFAGFGVAVVMSFALFGFATGVAVAYLLSRPLRGRGGAGVRLPGLVAVWILYVIVMALAFVGGLFFGLADWRTEASGAIAYGFLQGFGLGFWVLLLSPSREGQATGGRGWLAKAIGLGLAGSLSGILVGVVMVVYVFGPLNR